MLRPGSPEAARLLVYLRYLVVAASTLIVAPAFFIFPSALPFTLQVATLNVLVLALTVLVSAAAHRGSPRLLRRVMLAAFLSDLGLVIIGLMASGFSNGNLLVLPILTVLSAAVLLGERPAAACAIAFGLAYPAATLLVRAGLWPLTGDLRWAGDRAQGYGRLLLFVVGQEVFLALVIAPSLWIVGRLRHLYRDYSARHATAERELRRRERHYQLLADNVTDMVTLCTPALEVTFASPSARTVVGHAPEELLGRSLRELVHPDDLQAFAQALDRHLRDGDTGAELLCEFRARHRDGHWVWLETRGRMLAATPDGPGGVVLSSRDISQRRRLEAQVLQAQKLESLGLLAGGVAHDFNNILTSNIGNAELAARRLPATAELQAPLGKIGRAAERAAELCKQMMSFSGAGQPQLAPLDVNQVIRDIPALLGAAIPAKAVLSYELAPELPLVEADAAQLRQVAMNLVINAAEALSEGGDVRVASRVTAHDEEEPRGPEQCRVEPLPAPAPGDYVFIQVTDTGCGMDQATLERIFDPFFSTKFPGRGLGLSALLGIVRAHRGLVRVTSRPGHGTTFTVGFPANAQLRATPAEPQGDGEWRGGGRVLVVDDEDDVLEIVGDMLATIGFEVLVANGGTPGVELFRRHADEIAFVMCDVAMPGMSGEELVRAIRAIRPDVRVALMSGFGRDQVERRLDHCKVDQVIQKPFALEALRATARAMLGAPPPASP